MNGIFDVFKMGKLVHPVLFNSSFVLPRMSEKHFIGFYPLLRIFYLFIYLFDTNETEFHCRKE
jgi:hypothetical protein